MPNSEFIQNMNRQCIDFNITSSINKVGDCKNIKDLILFIFDKMMKVNGDGIVSDKQEWIRPQDHVTKAEVATMFVNAEKV